MNGKKLEYYQFINQAIDLIVKIIDLFRYYLSLNNRAAPILKEQFTRKL